MLVALSFMICAAATCIFCGAKRHLIVVRKGHAEETLKSGDAAAFPITGSCVLFGLYTILKFVPKSIVSMVLSGYLSIASVFALGAALRIVTGPRVLTGVVSVAAGVAYVLWKSWVLNNVLAIAICITAISSLPINNFKTSAILLIGLFFYDVFWVFGTDVMVSVATGIDGPIKILFPQTIFGSHEKKSLLGLGDIVIPGFFVAQTLVFSVEYAKRGTYYFTVAMIAYVLSLVHTMVVMVVFNHAQPALLYIVPWLLISTVASAAVKGDLRQLWEYDVETVQPKKKKSVVASSNSTSNEETGDALGGLLWALVKELFGYGSEDEGSTQPQRSSGKGNPPRSPPTATKSAVKPNASATAVDASAADKKKKSK